MSDARDAVYKKNPRDKKNAAEVQGVKKARALKTSRLQGVGLPGGPEEHVAAGTAVPVVDAHDTLVDVEYGADAIREHYSGTGAAFPLEEVFTGDAEMHGEYGRADGRGQLLERSVEPRQEIGVLLMRHPVALGNGDTGMVIARRGLPRFLFLVEIVDDLTGRNQLPEGPAVVPHHTLAVGGLRCLLLAVVGETKDAARGFGVVDERREQDGPRCHKALHCCRVRVAHGEPALHIDPRLGEIVHAEIEIPPFQLFEIATHDNSFRELEELVCRQLRAASCLRK